MAVKPFDYQAVGASETDMDLGPVGRAKDVLARLICTVDTAATSAVSLKDGAGAAIPILPANTPVGVHVVEVQAQSNDGAWKLTTAAGVTVLAVGRFS